MKSQADDTETLLAVMVGNTTMQWGLFKGVDRLPIPSSVCHLSVRAPEWGRLQRWLSQHTVDGTPCYVASVFDKAMDEMQTWYRDLYPDCRWTTMRSVEFPIATMVEHPEQVGADRLAAALAADRLRAPERSAIVVDSGTAITVNAIDAAGCFQGGAILPGVALSMKALADGTDRLPQLSDPWRFPRDAVGRNTEEAMRSGISWGTVGAVSYLVTRMAQGLGTDCDFFITGGGGESLARYLDGFRYVEHLVLSGIALAARIKS